MGKRRTRVGGKPEDLPWWAKYFKHNQHPDTIILGSRIVAAVLLLCFAIAGYMMGQDAEFKAGDIIVITETFVISESGSEFELGTEGHVLRVPGDDDEDSPAVVQIGDVIFDAPSGNRIVLRDSPKGKKLLEERKSRSEETTRKQKALEDEAAQYTEDILEDEL
eukprot:TRINITY_DN16343_c1_g1_i1.p1 TRINITY_DN16343_c1_g1~~TRINITY_DN16343_c1_g1_i1.p1  ORF type:complete len:164 (-),score=40.17 TRINITY_DN16343_c1_g1_i1:397-888(-)